MILSPSSIESEKKEGWQVWQEYLDATMTFLKFSCALADISDADLAVVERFVVLHAVR